MTTKKRKKRTPRARPYVMPKSAAELGINCAECGAPSEWFDPERARGDHQRGFICSNESRSKKSERLLIKEQTARQSA
jgi:hypothetical protein